MAHIFFIRKPVGFHSAMLAHPLSMIYHKIINIVSPNFTLISNLYRRQKMPSANPVRTPNAAIINRSKLRRELGPYRSAERNKVMPNPPKRDQIHSSVCGALLRTKPDRLPDYFPFWWPLRSPGGWTKARLDLRVGRHETWWSTGTGAAGTGGSGGETGVPR